MTSILRKETSNYGTNVYFECDYCGKESVVCQGAFKLKKNHFCSKDCNNNFFRGKPKFKTMKRDEEYINKLWYLYTTKPLTEKPCQGRFLGR